MREKDRVLKYGLDKWADGDAGHKVNTGLKKLISRGRRYSRRVQFEILCVGSTCEN